MTDRWLLERVLAAASGSGNLPVAAHWLSPDLSRACVVTSNGYLVETNLRTFAERVVRLVEGNAFVTHARFLVGPRPIVVLVVGRPDTNWTRLFLYDLAAEGRPPSERTFELGDPLSRHFDTRQSLDGSLFAVINGDECLVFDRDGTRLRDAFIEASFRSSTNVVLSASSVARIRDGDVYLSALNGDDEQRISCGLAHSEERLSLIAAGPTTVVIRRSKHSVDHAIKVDLAALRSARLNHVSVERDWHNGGCVADAHSIVVAGKSIRIYDDGQRAARAELPLSRARVAALTDQSIVVFFDARWSIVPRESASWAQRTSNDVGSIEQIHVTSDGAIAARDHDSTLFLWPASEPSPTASARPERSASSPGDTLVGLAEGGTSLVVLRTFVTSPPTSTLLAFTTRDGALDERWSVQFAPADDCWFDDEARVFVGSDRSNSASVVSADRLSTGPTRSHAARSERPRHFVDERTFETLTRKDWARFELVGDEFVERVRRPLRSITKHALVASRTDAPDDSDRTSYGLVLDTPNGARVHPAFRNAHTQLSRDETLVAFVIETQRSIAVCAPDGSDFTQWLAVDPDDPLDTISAVAIAPDASRIAVGTARGTIRVFRRPSPPPQPSAPAPP